MRIHTVTYNLGMGSARDPKRLLSANAAINALCDGMASLAGASTDEWILCVQEINCDEGGVNQVAQLYAQLQTATKRPWKMQAYVMENSSKKQALAIYTTGSPVKTQQYSLSQGQLGLGLKVDFKPAAPLWVVTTQLSSGSADPNGSARSDQLQEILKAAVTFDPLIPVLLCGDFNVADIQPGTYAETTNPAVYGQTVERVARLDFSRGTNFVPARADVTYPSWDGKPYDLRDYLFVNTAGACAPESPSVVNFTAVQNAQTLYVSDHKGVHLAIDYPTA